MGCPFILRRDVQVKYASIKSIRIYLITWQDEAGRPNKT